MKNYDLKAFFMAVFIWGLARLFPRGGFLPTKAEQSQVNLLHRFVC
jgi:hypothetical protein